MYKIIKNIKSYLILLLYQQNKYYPDLQFFVES